MIENDRSVWRHLVRPMVPWSGHFGHFVSRHQKCARRNVPSTIWSKFLYIATGIILTSKPKWNFCLMSYGLASWRIPCKCVLCSYRCDGSEIATVLNEFNQSLERKQNLICRRLFTASKKKKKSPIRKFYVLSLVFIWSLRSLWTLWSLRKKKFSDRSDHSDHMETTFQGSQQQRRKEHW